MDSRTSAAKPGTGKLTCKELLGFGVGGVAYNLGVDAIKNLANPVYNLLLGLNPAWIGTVMMIARIWDALTDPIMGTISDNCRSRWGRRRPFIFAGAVLCSLSFPLMWMAPRGMGETGTLAYFLATSILFYSCFTVFCIPYMTLSLELTPDYKEKTLVSAVRTLFAAVSYLIVVWVLPIAQLDFFPDALTGMRVAAAGIGIVFLATGLPSAIFTRERYQKIGQSQPRTNLREAFQTTLGRGPFRILIAISILMILGYNTFHALGIYVNMYYVCDGDLKFAATLQGWSGTLFVAGLLIGIPSVTWVSNRFGKVKALMFCLVLGNLGGLGKWFLYSPEHPYWQLVVPLFIAPCSAGFWVVVNAMKADACDCDELRSGKRREGAFAAVSSWVQKFSAALTFALTGYILVLVKFDQAKGADQHPGTVTALRLVFAIAPILFFTACLFLTRRLPFTAEYMKKVRSDLEARRNAV